MTDPTPSFFKRVSLAFGSFFSTLSNPGYAARVQDLREHGDARIGDPVVLWGEDLPVEEIAAHAGTIGYELVCGMTRRVRFLEDHR